jgi:hypothetical protein
LTHTNLSSWICIYKQEDFYICVLYAFDRPRCPRVGRNFENLNKLVRVELVILHKKLCNISFSIYLFEYLTILTFFDNFASFVGHFEKKNMQGSKSKNSCFCYYYYFILCCRVWKEGNNQNNKRNKILENKDSYKWYIYIYISFSVALSSSRPLSCVKRKEGNGRIGNHTKTNFEFSSLIKHFCRIRNLRKLTWNWNKLY